MYIVSAFRKIYGMVVFKLFVKQMGFIRNPHCIKELLMYVDSLDIGAPVVVIGSFICVGLSVAIVH